MKRKHHLAWLAPALWYLLTASPVHADDGLPRTPLNLDPAHLPAYERYPVWAYTVDAQITDGAVRQLVHLTNGLNLTKAWVLKLAIRGMEYAMTWQLPREFTGAVDHVVSSLHTLLWEGDLSPIVTAAIVLTGLTALWLAGVRGRTRAAWASVLRLFAVIALGATVMGSAGTWAPSLISLTADLNSMLFTEVARPAAPAAATQAEMVQKWALTATGDAAWRYFVVDPWAVQEFGSMDAAGRYAQDGIPGGLLLAQAPGRRLDWYWTQSPAVRERDLGWWSEDAMPRRLTLAAVSTAGALVYAAGLFLLAGGVLVYQLVLLLLLMAAPFLFLLALWPGFGQTWVSRWVRGVLRSLVGQTVYACSLGLLVVLTAAGSSLEGSLGWELVALLLVGTVVGIFLVRRLLSVWRCGRGVGAGRPEAEGLRPEKPGYSQPLPATDAGEPVQHERSLAVAVRYSRERSGSPSADALAHELAIQRTRALIAGSEAGPVQRPAGLPQAVRESLAPALHLARQAQSPQPMAVQVSVEPPASASAGTGGTPVGAGVNRDLRGGRPTSLLITGTKTQR